MLIVSITASLRVPFVEFRFFSLTAVSLDEKCSSSDGSHCQESDFSNVLLTFRSEITVVVFFFQLIYGLSHCDAFAVCHLDTSQPQHYNHTPHVVSVSSSCRAPLSCPSWTWTSVVSGTGMLAADLLRAAVWGLSGSSLCRI